MTTKVVFIICRGDNSMSKEDSEVPCFRNTTFVYYCFHMQEVDLMFPIIYFMEC